MRIRDFFLTTKKTRGALPDKVSLKDAAFNISRASMLQAALTTGDYDLLKIGAEDRLHQPYRKSYIDGFDEIFEHTYRIGSKATYLSGSGPTIMSILTGNGAAFKKDMEAFFSENEHRWKCMLLECDNVGSVLSETRS